MSSLAFLLLMQYVVSVKAGLVNHVQGPANVAPMEMARQGRPIRTAADGYVEVLLTPGSFLRLGENSEAVLDGVELDNVNLRLVKGPAVIEVIDSNYPPMRVTTGNLTMTVKRSGIYRFENGVATVVQGKLETADSKLTYEKGWQIFFQDNYRARKVNTEILTSLDAYSDNRSERIAQANYTLASQMRTSSYDYDYWLYAPFIGMYTFIPRNNFRSPYGYRYYAVRDSVPVVRSGVVSTATGSSSGGTTITPSTPTSSGNSGADSGGGGAAPAVTVTTPAGERSTPATYIEGKNSPVGATQ